MDLQYFGANCITVTVGSARLVIDDNLAELGGKPVARSGDIVLSTGPHGLSPVDAKLWIDMPGEYEVSGVSISGIQVRSHIDEAKQRSATMFKLAAKDVRILVTGHIFPKLQESDLERIGTVDVMVVPVGGNGYTLDPVGALELIKEIEPKLVIPTYYDDPKLTLPVPAQALEQALHGLAMEPRERIAKLKLKHGDLPEDTQLVVLEKS